MMRPRAKRDDLELVEDGYLAVLDSISQRDLEDVLEEIELSQWIFDTFPCRKVRGKK